MPTPTTTRAIFLDRDGTLNPDENGYIAKPCDFELYPYSAAAIKLFSDLGFLVFIITNQSGIARGYYSEQDLQAVHTKMERQLVQGGAKVDEILHCPHHPRGSIQELSCGCQCRKPGNLFFRQLQKKYRLRASQSFMIGDKPSDIGFGKNSGMQTILVRTGMGEQTFLEGDTKADFVVDDLLAAAKLVQRLQEQKKDLYAKV